jgi:hypothetical protein
MGALHPYAAAQDIRLIAAMMIESLGMEHLFLDPGQLREGCSIGCPRHSARWIDLSRDQAGPGVQRYTCYFSVAAGLLPLARC